MLQSVSDRERVVGLYVKSSDHKWGIYFLTPKDKTPIGRAEVMRQEISQYYSSTSIDDL